MLPQGSPIQFGLMEVETTVLGTSPDSPTNALCYGIKVQLLGEPWKMGNFVLMLLKPPHDDMCPVD